MNVAVRGADASGLALVAPLLAEGLTLELDGQLVSLPYLDMTLAMMGRAGASASRSDRVVTIASSGYRAPSPIVIERDWSAAAYLLTAGRLLDREVEIRDLTPPAESLQGDAAIVDLLDRLGRGQATFDLTHTPDLIGPLTAASLFADTAVRIRGAAHTRVKECDRVAVLCRELAKISRSATSRV